jgi:HEAT repeat protein
MSGRARHRPLWPDYRALGLSERHVPELIAACRTHKIDAAHTGKRATDGNCHAWRALGQIATPEALDFLTAVLERVWVDNEYCDLVFDDDSQRMEELGPILSQAGEAAVDRMLRVMKRPGDLFTRDAAAHALSCIAHKHPELRPRVLHEIVGELENPENDEQMTTAFAGILVSMRAVEAAGALGRQFDNGRIETSTLGHWELVRADLGLTTHFAEEPGP